MKIYLIRHGEARAAGNNENESMLTPKGLRQADLLGRRLVKYGIEKIYSSDMTRAVQTARTIDGYLKTGIILRRDLREIDMGECLNGWDGMEERHPDFMAGFALHDADVPYPGGECGKDVWLRSFRVIDEIIHTDLENVAVVAHGGTICSLISGRLGLGQEKRFFIGAPIENCSISAVRYEKDARRYYVHTVNDYAHLEQDSFAEPEQ